MIKRILLGLGGSHYTVVAIQRAVWIAKSFDAEITGVTVLSLIIWQRSTSRGKKRYLPLCSESS